MVEAAPTGWLGVGRPVGPPVPWPRDMRRALPAPCRVSSSSTSRGVRRPKPGGIDAGPDPGSDPPLQGKRTRGRPWASNLGSDPKGGTYRR